VHRVGAQDFHKAIDKAKSANAYGAAVELHPAEQMRTDGDRGRRLFVLAGRGCRRFGHPR
jgi:hypothetical protein